jgi:hypothetical protein
MWCKEVRMPKAAMVVFVLVVIAFLVVLYAPALAQLANLVRRFVTRQIETARRYYNSETN